MVGVGREIMYVMKLTVQYRVNAVAVMSFVLRVKSPNLNSQNLKIRVLAEITKF